MVHTTNATHSDILLGKKSRYVIWNVFLRIMQDRIAFWNLDLRDVSCHYNETCYVPMSCHIENN